MMKTRNIVKIKILIILVFFLINTYSVVKAQVDKEFWFAAPDITSGHPASGGGGEPIYLRMATLSLAANITVDIPAAGIIIANITVPANTAYTINLTPWITNLENTNYGTIEDKGLHILSDNSITAYYEEAQYYDPDIFALKGGNSLGNDFWIPLQNLWDNGVYTPTPYAGFIIVATANNTSVTITPSKNIVGHAAGIPFSILLDKGQTYSCVATTRTGTQHPAGSHVTSTKPVAVTIYDDSSTHPAGGCRDLNGDQLIPVDVIGKTYIALKSGLTSNETIFILATQNNTNVSFDGGVPQNIPTAGMQINKVLTNKSTYIAADKPVYVLHIAGYGCEIGAAVLPSIDGCTGSYEVYFFRSTTQSFYMNLMIREGTAKSQFFLEYENGTTFHIPVTWFESVPGNPGWVTLKDANCLFANNNTSGVPYNQVTRIYNTEDIFHMGFNNGGSSTGCNYGYFSDYKGSRGFAGESGTEFKFIQQCYGIPIQLIADGGVAYSWSPTIYLDDRYSPTPIINAISGPHHYDVTINRPCYGDTTLGIDISVFEKVDAQFSLDKTQGCADMDVKITDNSIGADPTRYRWDYGDGSGIDFTSTSPKTHTYYNATENTIQTTIFLQVKNYADCVDTLRRQIIVQPFINADFEPTDTIGCNPMPVQFRNLTTGGNMDTTKYTWEFGDGGSSYDSIPFYQYTNSAKNDTSYVAQLSVESKFGCKDTTWTDIKLHSFIKADFTVSKVSGCSPLYVDIVHKTYPGISTYTWTFGDGSPGFSGANPPQKKYVNLTGLPVTYPIKLVVSNGNCTDSLIRNITVYPEVTADFTPLVPAPVGCNPDTILFTNKSLFTSTVSTAGLIYLWDFGDGSTTDAVDPTHIFINTSNNDTVYDVNLQVTTPSGCMHDTSTTVTVNAYIEPFFTVNVVKGCSPLTIQVNNQSLGGITQFNWDIDGNGSIDRNDGLGTFNIVYPVNTTGSPINYNLTLTVVNSAGCSKKLVRKITVYSEVTASIVPDVSIGCNPLTVNFPNNSSAWTANYSWNFGDGGTSNSPAPTHDFVNISNIDTTFNVELVATTINGCTDTANANITVHEYINADFAVSEPVGCAPFEITITNNSAGGISSYLWDYGDGSPTSTTGASHSHIYNNATLNPVSYNLVLQVRNNDNCLSTKSRQINIYPQVIANFSMNDSANCHPLAVHFTNSSIVPDPATYSWNFDDGASSSIKDPDHTFYNFSSTTDLTRQVQLIATSEYYCADTIKKEVTIYHNPIAKFTLNKTVSCPPFMVVVTNSSIGGNTYNWDWDDGTNETTASLVTLSHTFPINTTSNIENFDMELTVETDKGCSHSLSQTLSAYPQIVADFTYDSIGCNPVTSSFVNTSTGPSSYFFWNFKDGSSSNQENPTHLFVNTGSVDKVFDVFFEATSEYNCKSSITKPVKVFVQPITEFDVLPVVQKFPSNQVSIDNKSGAGPFSYLWEFGDDETSNAVEPNEHVYEHWGEYDITLTINSNTSSCSDSKTRNITILPPDVVANFSTNIDEGCLNDGLEVQFTANQSGYDEEYDYIWDFGDGSGLAYNRIESHVYEQAGTYQVKLTAKSNEIGGGEAYRYKQIKVYTNPKAYFEVTPNVAMLNASTLEARIEFFNLSECNDTSGCAYLWNFGDETTAISRDVTHSYKELGTYDIKLTVSNSHGCTDTLFLPKEVEIIGAGEIAFPNAFTPNGDGLNDSFKPVSQGVIKYKLLIYNRWGELIFETNDLSVGWDGQIKGNYAKPDVYVWKAQGTFTNGHAFELAGDVTLIR